MRRLQLPSDARARLAGALVRSLDDDDETPLDQAEYDAAWAAEIGRRLDEVDCGTAKTTSWSEARRQILADC